MDDVIEQAIFEARGGRVEPDAGYSLDGYVLRSRLWDNPCWLSFRLNFTALGFNTPVYNYLGEKYGLLRSDMVVLWSLFLNGETPFSDVVRAVGFPKNTLSRAARKLEDLGMIKRRSHANDMRVVMLSLADKGTQIATEARSVMMTQEASMLKCLTPAERLMLSDLLFKLVAGASDWPQHIDPTASEPSTTSDAVGLATKSTT